MDDKDLMIARLSDQRNRAMDALALAEATLLKLQREMKEMREKQTLELSAKDS